ncbi:uncharacterized protein LOC113465031 [Ceratina calcarata]|uniref:Uncharacterized protein LOC113465031 n=1 Tax=Ceratina calcarata TaxID=156304 RepID=A0AAJ7S9Z3_9HYME|nr:uncharacterized protein LOC113465031 [Ceratina calcarata]
MGASYKYYSFYILRDTTGVVLEECKYVRARNGGSFKRRERQSLILANYSLGHVHFQRAKYYTYSCSEKRRNSPHHKIDDTDNGSGGISESRTSLNGRQLGDDRWELY